MPKFRVVKGHDAWVEYEAIVEADSADNAFRIANARNFRLNGDNWGANGAVDEFDHCEVFSDRTEEVSADEELEPIVTLTMSPEERDTILAALRLWQCFQTGGSPSFSQTEALFEVATNAGEHPGLDAEGIDALCERINC